MKIPYFLNSRYDKSVGMNYAFDLFVRRFVILRRILRLFTFSLLAGQVAATSASANGNKKRVSSCREVTAKVGLLGGESVSPNAVAARIARGLGGPSLIATLKTISTNWKIFGRKNESLNAFGYAEVDVPQGRFQVEVWKDGPVKIRLILSPGEDAQAMEKLFKEKVANPDRVLRRDRGDSGSVVFESINRAEALANATALLSTLRAPVVTDRSPEVSAVSGTRPVASQAAPIRPRQQH